MTIGINGYEAVVPRFGFDKETGLPIRVGSSEYVFQLLLNLNKIDKTNVYRIYIPPIDSSPEKLGLPKENKNWLYIKVSKKFGPWTLTDLSKKLSSDKKVLDVFFSPTHYLPLRVPMPCVISILDVSYLYFPELFKKKDLYKLKLWGRYSIKRADKVLTISKSSKNDIINEYKLKPEKVAVTYPGIREILKTSMKEDLVEKFGIKGDYILFVGTLQPRKNIKRLIEAFSRLKTDLELVIVGKKGWMYEEILNAPKEYGISDKVRFLDSVTNEDLPSLYKNALCFILPSLYEGFGLPILEAMQYGCPVITSSISSLPEAAGEAALYVNPEDVDDIAQKLEKMINDSNLREDLIKKGYEQVKKFSWEKTAKETLNVLEEVAKK
ncbi:MAG: hypothetical protein A2W22_03535 [Candidatus Levybacteria bacterium RBG_16_35_11]|nr:MAG: hypothetical protein A2W22_03535 [Candidatus Levybacteria bacterium RBG_16_35_11]